MDLRLFWLRLKSGKVRFSPWWIWKIHLRGHDVFGVFRNRPDVRKDGTHYRWGVRFLGIEFGNRG